MKKLLVLMLCLTIVCALPTIVFASEGETTLSTTSSVAGIATTAVEASDTPVSSTVPDSDLTPFPDEGGDDTASDTFTEIIKAWILENFEEISVVATLIVGVIYEIRKHGLLNKSIGTLNNNAVTVAENSSSAISQALTGVSGVATIVSGFTEQMQNLLAEVRKNAEDKEALEKRLEELTKYFKTAKLANVELANELAELLVLANIPNSKKEELYSRHRAAVDAIASAEQTEVTTDDEQKA